MTDSSEYLLKKDRLEHLNALCDLLEKVIADKMRRNFVNGTRGRLK